MTGAGTDSQWVELLQARLGDHALGADDLQRIERSWRGFRDYRRGENIIERRKPDAPLHLVVHGWAARFSLLRDGTRQITDFVLPGEFCDLSRLSDGLSGAAVALTPIRVALLDRSEMLAAVASCPAISCAFLSLALSEQAILREWAICLGRRGGREHMAHLICELHRRLRRASMVADHEFNLPLTQEQIADAMGMTAVHANRVLQQLRREGTISLGHRQLKIHHPHRLEVIGEFDEAYLTA